jgi:uncharacterized repeat protein (TIGR01451 family)
MTNVPTWISRMSAVALATASVSAFASAPNAPDFVIHDANVKFKVSSQGGTEGSPEIDKETIKTKNLINVIMGRSIDAKNEKGEKLGLVTGCAADVDGVALVVYDKKTDERISNPENTVFLYFEDGVIEEDKNGDLKKADVTLYNSDEAGWLDVSGQVKYGKIGNKCAKDGDNKDHWDKNSVCAKNFKSKSVVGGGLFGDIVMSGKVSAGSCKFAADYSDAQWPGDIPSLAITKTDSVSGELDGPGTIDYTILVQNNGDVNLTGVSINDTGVDGNLSCDGGNFDGTLAVGESTTCTGSTVVDQARFDAICDDETGFGAIGNFASASSDQSNPIGTVNFVDLDCFPVVAPGENTFSIIKTADAESASVGDTVNYDIVVTNTGTADQSGILVLDYTPVVGGAPEARIPDCPQTTLASGASMTCTSSWTIREFDRDEACDNNQGLLRNIARVESDQSDPVSFATDAFVGIACPR